MSRQPVFFTGGSALRDLSRELAKRNIPSTHLVTTFDSGGSSAALRKAFAMPAVGDLRNRLLALADRKKTPEAVLEFCNLRLPLDCAPEEARRLLARTVDRHPVWQEMPEKFSIILQRNLQYFLKRMPQTFDARGACLGNLLLAGSYLENTRDFEPALALFSSLFHIHGMVLPIVNSSLHLGALLENGRYIVGQHRFRNLPAPVKWLFLTVHESENAITQGCLPQACRPEIRPQTAARIEGAGLVCYPMGSFYSSLLVNLLPAGVGRAIAKCPASKIFIPNTGNDPELGGLPVFEQAALILGRLAEDIPGAQPGNFLTHILVDSKNGVYPGGMGSAAIHALANLGLEVLDRRVVLPDNPRKHSPDAVLKVLGELARKGGQP